MRVRVGSKYRYSPSFWELVHPTTEKVSALETGAEVYVINLFGCPPANTMGQCYISTTKGRTGFIGMVSTNSLEKIRS